MPDARWFCTHCGTTLRPCAEDPLPTCPNGCAERRRLPVAAAYVAPLPAAGSPAAILEGWGHVGWIDEDDLDPEPDG